MQNTRGWYIHIFPVAVVIITLPFHKPLHSCLLLDNSYEEVIIIYICSIVQRVILAPCWHDYLPLLICHIICFAMKIDSNFLIALECSWNPAWWGFEVINPQAFWKLKFFPINIQPTPHFYCRYFCAQRSKFLITLFSISAYLWLRPRITSLASNCPFSNFTSHHSKYLSLIFVPVKQAAQLLDVRKELLFILILWLTSVR